VSEDRNEEDEYSFLQVYRKPGPTPTRCRMPEPGEKTCAVVRYGAYGDVMQASSLLPALKAQGYHITFFTVDRGLEIAEHDPNIDRFIVQGENQVPQAALPQYFEWLKKKYDKLVNLCAIVESTLLPDHNSPHFWWPKEVRDEFCNKNYVEVMHRVGEVPYTVPKTKFYPTLKEKNWAFEQRKKLDGPVVVWSLSGSSPHKVWPYVDNVIARILLEHPTAHVVIVGAPSERWLAESWKNERRVRNKAGEWTIRDVLAFSQRADLVVGPETGVLNAMAMEECWKILFLSHSTVENLCRDWVNTHAFAATGVECYPCHRLHREGWKHCNRHPEGLAVCQVAIGLEDVWPAFDLVLKNCTQPIAA
jgi:ADP-heptose:LPS heptosyltransferase